MPFPCFWKQSPLSANCTVLTYRCIIAELDHFGFPSEAIYLSLERRMKCGMGLCCHCAIGELFCCTDEPVFRYCDIEGAL